MDLCSQVWHLSIVNIVVLLFFCIAIHCALIQPTRRVARVSNFPSWSRGHRNRWLLSSYSWLSLLVCGCCCRRILVAPCRHTMVCINRVRARRTCPLHIPACWFACRISGAFIDEAVPDYLLVGPWGIDGCSTHAAWIVVLLSLIAAILDSHLLLSGLVVLLGWLLDRPGSHIAGHCRLFVDASQGRPRWLRLGTGSVLTLLFILDSHFVFGLLVLH